MWKGHKRGAYRAKQHLDGAFRNIRAYPKVPSHIRGENKKVYVKKKANKESICQTPIFSVDDFDDEDPDLGMEVNSQGKRVSSEQSCSRGSTLKTTKTKGPMDLFCRTSAEQFKKDRKEEKERQQAINEVKKKERDRCAHDIARWFYDAAIPFNAINHESFEVMVESIGRYGSGLKVPSMYELRVPLLKKEVDDVNLHMKVHQDQWAKYGCSILSDGWRDSTVENDLLNFLVNSPKGSLFIKSIDVSDVCKNAERLFMLLDSWVEEIGEKNVVQVVKDNASAYIAAGESFILYFYSYNIFFFCKYINY